MYQVIKLKENLYAFDEGGVRSFLLLGTEKAALIDTGLGAVDFKKELPALTNLPVMLINTHGDHDHTGGNALFAECYAAPQDWEQIQTSDGCADKIYLPLSDGEEISLGNCSLQVITCPGHTPGSIMLYLPEEKILFSGDSLSKAPIWMFGEKRNISRYLQSLKRMEEMRLEVSLLLASHGECPIENYDDVLKADILVAELCIKDKAEWEPVTLQTSGGPKEVRLNRAGIGQLYTVK